MIILYLYLLGFVYQINFVTSEVINVKFLTKYKNWQKNKGVNVGQFFINNYLYYFVWEALWLLKENTIFFNHSVY